MRAYRLAMLSFFNYFQRFSPLQSSWFIEFAFHRLVPLPDEWKWQVEQDARIPAQDNSLFFHSCNMNVLHWQRTHRNMYRNVGVRARIHVRVQSGSETRENRGNARESNLLLIPLSCGFGDYLVSCVHFAQLVDKILFLGKIELSRYSLWINRRSLFCSLQWSFDQVSLFIHRLVAQFPHLFLWHFRKKMLALGFIYANLLSFLNWLRFLMNSSAINRRPSFCNVLLNGFGRRMRLKTK